MEREIITLNEERDVTLTVYTQGAGDEFRRAPRRPAVLILPGGGYTMCSEREADPVAFAYLAAGFQAFVLRYSVGEHAVWPNPLDDYEQAMALIRSRADAWGVYPDKVAVVGFSAGGHLAGVAATSARERPNAAVLGYAALGGWGTPANTGAPAAASAVDALTPPCFVFASASDTTVPVTNSIEFIGALARAGISFESHIYAFAPHGFSTGTAALEDPARLCSRAPHWVADSVAWLGDVLGLPGEEGMGEPRCNRWLTVDDAPYLSLDCSMGRVLACPAARELLAGMAALAPLFALGGGAANGAAEAQPGAGLAAHVSLGAILRYARVPADEIERLGRALSAIENRPAAE